MVIKCIICISWQTNSMLKLCSEFRCFNSLYFIYTHIHINICIYIMMSSYTNVWWMMVTARQINIPLFSLDFLNLNYRGCTE